MSKAREFWQILRQQQLVSGEIPAELEQAPLYLRVFLSVALWMAAQSFMISVVAIPALILLSLGSTEQGWLFSLIGFVLLVLAAIGSRKKTSFFKQQLTVAAALTAAGLLAVGLVTITGYKKFDLVLIGVSALVFFSVNNVFIRSLCVPVFIVTGAFWLGGLDGLEASYSLRLALSLVFPCLLLVTAWLYLMETRWCRWQIWLHPLKRGLSVSIWVWLFLQHVQFLSYKDTVIWLHHQLPLTLVATVFSGWWLWRLGLAPAVLGFALTLGAVLLAAGWFIPGVTASCLLLALAWYQGQRYYWIAHLAALLAVLSFYYYNLEQTLLVKSAILLGLAALFFAIRLWLLRLPTLNREQI